MPGIIGFYGAPPSGDAAKFLAQMAVALEPDTGYRVELYHQPDLGLGRVSLPFVNPSPQPAWNAARTLCLVMEGEVYDVDNLLRRASQPGLDANGPSGQPGLLLSLYEQEGEAFVERLNGAFILAIWDVPSRKLTIMSDRLGNYPLFYARLGNRFIFGSGVRALLVDPDLPRRTDRVAIEEFLTFDHILDDRTLLESVKLFPQGSVMTYDGLNLAFRRYHEFRYPNPYPLRDKQEYVSEFLHLMEQAVKRQSADQLSKGVLLSGGLDSRYLAAYLPKVSASQPLHSFTWGIPGCDDAVYAGEIARQTGFQHHFYPLQPDWLLHKAADAVRITDGMGNVVNMHALATLEPETRHANVLFKGFLGDAMMGFCIRHQFFANYDPETAMQAHLQVHTDQGVITFNRDEKRLLFTDDFSRQVGTTVYDNYIRGMRDSGSDLLADQRNYFDYRQRVPRMTLRGVDVVRSRALVRLPFADNDLVDFALSIPPGLRYERKIAFDAFIQAFPRLAQIPTADTRLPMVECFRDIRMRTELLVRWHLHHRGFKNVSLSGARPYKDYNLWFRTVLRPWVENTLLDQRALDRGYFNPDQYKKVISEHMAGANYAVRLGAFLSIELWHKQFLD